MNDNGLSNVMELIKRRKWENLFKQRLLVHVDHRKGVDAKMKVTHLRKKDVIKSSVKGIDIEFDHERLATILGVHSENGMREYIKEDHELPYGHWLTLVFEAFGVPLVIKKGEEPKKYDFFEDTFLTMCKLTREDGVWWIGSGENRRRDDAPEEKEEEEEERNKDDFDWEAVIDEATVEGESGSDDQFYDAQVGEEEPVTETPTAPAVPASSSAQQQDKEPSGVDPSGPTGREADFLKFQAEFERKRANQFHEDLEKAKAENARLLALLHQAQFKSNP
ncbi:hypothetical protein Dimus_029971 [Dionaea muscipula]